MLAWSPYAADPLDFRDAFEQRLAQTGARQRGRRPIAAHLLCIVSPLLLREAGDPHDLANPVNDALLREAVWWAESVFGDGAVIAARVDLDEVGSGVADVFVVPVVTRSVNRDAAARTEISLATPLARLAAALGASRTYAALQTSWAAHARSSIDPRLTRGTPKKQTARDHVSADVYRALAEELRPMVHADLVHDAQCELRAEYAALADEAARLAIARERLRDLVTAERAATARARTEIQQLRHDAVRDVGVVLAAVVTDRIDIDATGRIRPLDPTLAPTAIAALQEAAKRASEAALPRLAAAIKRRIGGDASPAPRRI